MKKLNIFLNTSLIISVIVLILFGITSYFAVKYMNITRWSKGAFRSSAAGYEMTPSCSSRMFGGRFFARSHKLGYRIPEFADDSIIKEGGILSIGCSFTYGDGVEAEQTFTYLVADNLHLPSYNYGVCSYSYANIILQLKELKDRGILAKLKPTIIILGTGDWLVQRSLSPFMPTNGPPLVCPYIMKKDNIIQITRPPRALYIKYLYDGIEGNINNISNKSRFDLKSFCSMILVAPRILYVEFIKRNYKKSDISSIELYNFVISEIKKIISPYQMKFLVLWMPRNEDEFLDEELRKAIEEDSDVILVDGLNAIRKYGLEKKNYIKRHPSPEAHKAYAEAIIAALRQ